MNNLVLSNLMKLVRVQETKAQFDAVEEKKLKKQSELFTRNAKDLVETMGAARALMSFRMVTPPFEPAAGSQVSRNYKQAYDSAFLKGMDVPPAIFQMTDRQIIIGKEYPAVSFNVPLTGNAQQDSRTINEAQAVINEFLPKFQIPTQWKTDEDGERILSFGKSAALTNSLTLEEISRIRVPNSGFSAASMPPDRHLALSKQYKRLYGQMGYMRFSIDQRDSGISASIAGDSGKLLGVVGDLRLTMRIIAEVRVPLKMAYWMTYAHDARTFLPYAFAEHFATLWAYGSPRERGRKRARPTVRRSNVMHVMQLMTEDAKTIEVPPRINDEGFTILRNGSIFYIPEQVTGLAPIIDHYKKAYDPAEQTLKKVDLETEGDKPVAVDWVNQRFIFTTRSNSIQSINLEGCKPLDPVTIYTLFQGINITGKTMESFFQVLATSAIARPEVYQQAIQSIVTNMAWEETSIFDRTRSEIARIARDEELTMIHLLGLVDVDEFKKPRDARIWPIVAQGFIDLCEAAYSDFVNIDAPVPQKYGLVRMILEMTVRYSKNFEQYKQQYSEAFQANSRRVQQLPKKVELPNIPGLKSLMPHQTATFTALDMTEGSGIVGVDPGGGKTILDIADFLNLLAKGKVKRGLIIAPGTIVPEWVREINTISQGKINAFPLNSAVYRRLTRNAKFTDEFIVNLLKGLPINSIVITDFPFLRGRSEAISYLNNDKPVIRFPNAEMLLEVGFDYIAVDESHRIKKQSSQQTQAVYLLSSFAKYFRLLSGTIISDKPTDMVGQVGLINPAILGDADNFKKTYGRGSGWARDAATQVARRIMPYARQITVKRREWAFLLPKIDEEFHTVDMTTNQRVFYAELLQEILDKILQDADLMRKMEEGGEEVEAEIEAALRLYFVKLEIFMNAPDANPAFAALRRNKKEDLISPKVAKVDEILSEHLRNKKSLEENQDKIIVFGYNKAVSRHIFQHSKHRSLMVHYSAGNEDALNLFRTNPKVQILVADENSIKEGINLQIASMMIRLQTLWSPGNQEQALSRIFRPDPRGKFKREKIKFHWIIIDNSIEVAKTARLISKIITKARFDEENNPSFRAKVGDRVDELPLISMNLDTIQDYTNINDLTGATGRGNFFGSYQVLKAWEDDSFDDEKVALKARLERELGRDIKDEDIAEKAMVPVESKAELPNSRGYFTPWVKNVTPPDFPELRLVPITETENDVEEDEDEEGEETGEEINVARGDLVFTEFGPGYIRTIARKSIRVDIPGFAKGIRLWKYNAYIPTNQDAARKFERKLRKMGKKGLPKLSMKGVKDAYFDIEEQSPREKEAERKRDKREGRSGRSRIKPEDHNAPDKAKAIYLHVALINGIVTLITDADDVDAAKVMPKLGYNLIEASYYQTVRSFRAMDRYMTKLDSLYTEGKINLRDAYWEELERMQEIYKRNKDALGMIKKTEFKEIRRNFLLVSHRKPKDKKTLRPYSLFWDGELLFLYNVRTQPGSLLRRHFNDIPGVSKIGSDTILAPSYVKMLPRKSAVKAELKAIADAGIIIQNQDEFKTELKALIG